MGFGARDCCPGDGHPGHHPVPLSAYLDNVEALYAKKNKIKNAAANKSLAPGGSIVWVTTTPHATMSGYIVCGLEGPSFNACIDEHNAAAITLLSTKPNVVVSDLGAAVTAVCGTNYSTCNLQRWRDTQFTSAGKQLCAVNLAHTVAPLIGPKWHDLTSTSGGESVTECHTESVSRPALHSDLVIVCISVATVAATATAAFLLLKFKAGSRRCSAASSADDDDDGAGSDFDCDGARSDFDCDDLPLLKMGTRRAPPPPLKLPPI